MAKRTVIATIRSGQNSTLGDWWAPRVTSGDHGSVVVFGKIEGCRLHQFAMSIGEMSGDRCGDARRAGIDDLGERRLCCGLREGRLPASVGTCSPVRN